MNPIPFSELKTPGGYSCGEVTSALQKSVRRGLEDEALFWATELDLAGYGGYVWKRLRIMASEDIGLAASGVVTEVRALYDNWTEQRKNKADKSGAERLFLIHAVLILVRVKKSRMVDNVLMTYYEGPRFQRAIPDYALDKHTRRGRQLGRGHDHFFDVGAQLSNEAPLIDVYAESGRLARSRKKPTSPEQLENGITHEGGEKP